MTSILIQMAMELFFRFENEKQNEIISKNELT